MSDRIQQIRDYVDNHDLSDEIEKGHWETDVVDDPMITTSLRLPKSLLDWVRNQAAEQHVKPTAWIRDLLEQQRAGRPDLEHRVSSLEAILASVMAAAQRPERDTTTHGTRASAVAGARKTAKVRTRSRIAQTNINTTRSEVEKGAQENLKTLRRLAAAHDAKKK
ncbi:hypothetical protein [Actinophytocola glycyrrhizae]|uniref:Uncharacterized protein n=1 Tax=Actinophytocola glycyrrhizae TaxID=2044873 RepID=A0ABV9RYU4_9PSEU